MAGSVNKVILVGNLGRDPEVRSLNDGSPVVNLALATSDTWRDKQSGERRERTEWHRIVIFNENLCRVAENYLRKGSKIFVEGQLQSRKFTDREGHERYTTEVVLQRYRGELQMLDTRSGGGAPAAGEGGAGYGAGDYGGGGAPASQDEPHGGGGSEDLDDEIPF